MVDDIYTDLKKIRDLLKAHPPNNIKENKLPEDLLLIG